LKFLLSSRLKIEQFGRKYFVFFSEFLISVKVKRIHVSLLKKCVLFIYSNKVHHLNLISRNCCLLCSRWSDASCRLLENLLGFYIWKTDYSNYSIHRCVVKFGRPVVLVCLLIKKELHEFDVHVTVHRVIFLITKPTGCTNFSNLFLE
jgi:hypothetical protein